MWSVVVAMASSAFTALPARAQAPAASALDTAPLLIVAAIRAREVAGRLPGGAAPAARTPAARAAARVAATQYSQGLDLLVQGKFDSAATVLNAAATASPDFALYRGDLAFAFAAGGHWTDAEDQYRVAVRLQQGNAWYYVGLGLTQMAQQAWGQAAASFTLAVGTDSAVIVRQMVEPVGDAYDQSRNTQALIDWSNMAAARFPQEPSSWLHLARANLSHDSAAGLADIRRYRALRPSDPVGELVYARYLYDMGSFDSAGTMAEAAAAKDTAMRRPAAILLYNAGAHYLEATKADSSEPLLEAGRDLADSADRPRYALLMGVAKLKMFQVYYNDIARHGDCHKAKATDSMLTDVVHTINEGAMVDTTLANQALKGTSQYRPVVDQFLHQCGGR